jgi:hypothetical protein
MDVEEEEFQKFNTRCLDNYRSDLKSKAYSNWNEKVLIPIVNELDGKGDIVGVLCWFSKNELMRDVVLLTKDEFELFYLCDYCECENELLQYL